MPLRQHPFLSPRDHPTNGRASPKRTLPGLAIVFIGRDPQSAAIAEAVERIIDASRYRTRLRIGPDATNIRVRIHLLSQAEADLLRQPRLIVIDDRPAGHAKPTPPTCGSGGHLLLPLAHLEAKLVPLIAELLPS